MKFFRIYFKKVLVSIYKKRSKKSINSKLFGHNVFAYFVYERMNRFKFEARKYQPFFKMSKFALFYLFKMQANLGCHTPKSCYTFRYDTTLRDTFFESQEFIHSFVFELA